MKRLTLVVYSLAAALLAVNVFRPSGEPGAASARTPAPVDRSGRIAVVDAPTDSMIRAAILGAPFRADRRPPKAPFGAQPAASKPGPVRPLLTLTGVVLGPEPRALVEGLPGAEGARILRAGDTAGGVRVRSIRRERVVLAGYDTVWVLSLARAVP